MDNELTKNSIIYVAQLLNKLLETYYSTSEKSELDNDTMNELQALYYKLDNYFEPFDPNKAGVYPAINPE